MKCSVILFISTFFFLSCRQYKRTIIVCDRNLFVETFNVNPAGVDSDYITDSLNFRMYVGKFDSDHEVFNYRCMGDSIVIRKFAQLDMSGMKVIKTEIFSLNDLKAAKKFE